MFMDLVQTKKVVHLQYTKSTGSLGGDTAIYIIESTTSGSVFRDQTDLPEIFQLSVSYSPNYGSAVVQSYTSSMSSIQLIIVVI